MSCDSLKEAVILAHDKLVKEEWSHKHCEGYLRVNGLNTDSMKQVLDNASLVLTHELTVRDKDINPENFHTMKKEKNNHRNVFIAGNSLLCGHVPIPLINLLMSLCIFSSWESRRQ